MSQEKHQRIENSSFLERYKDHWKIKDIGSLEKEDEVSSSLSSIDSTISNGSSSLDNMEDDGDSSSSSNLCSSSLYDLSELMSQLPIKRGLSKFYKGKSESFTSLSRVTSIEDLVKKQTPYRKREIKSSKRFGGGLDSYKLHTLPKASISKISRSRGSLFSSSYNFQGRRSNFVSSTSSKPPLTPTNRSIGC